MTDQDAATHTVVQPSATPQHLTSDNKDKIACTLARAHCGFAPAISRVVRIVSQHEAESAEPIKLLEINSQGWASGIWPIAFPPAPPEIPFGSVIIEVTQEEYDDILNGTLSLPDGWTLGPTLHPAPPR